MADVPRHEAARIAVLRGYGILDTPNEPRFDRIVRDVAMTFRVPIAIICLIDRNRQWFKARVGLTVQETPRAISFCTHAIRDNAVYEVADAALDPLFAKNPLVTESPGIRYYAGAPLRTEAGARIGTVCIIDTAPRAPLTDLERTMLASFARRVMSGIEVGKVMKARAANQNVGAPVSLAGS